MVDEALLARVAAGTATVDERTRARALLQSDPAAQRAYRILVESERTLAGRPVDEMSALELDRILPNVLDTISPAPLPKRATASRWLFALAPLVAAAAVVFVLVRPKANDDELTARGTATAAATFSLFCVANDGAAREMLGVDPHCARGS